MDVLQEMSRDGISPSPGDVYIAISDVELSTCLQGDYDKYKNDGEITPGVIDLFDRCLCNDFADFQNQIAQKAASLHSGHYSVGTTFYRSAGKVICEIYRDG